MEMTIESPVAAVTHAPMIERLQHEDRHQTAQRIANELYHRQPDWLTFFREVLGVDGVLRKLFASAEDLAAFEKTDQYAEIQAMLAKLRERNASQSSDREPTRVITVRLPKSLHESLRAEAHERNTSMNQLCIAKLLRVIEGEAVAAE